MAVSDEHGAVTWLKLTEHDEAVSLRGDIGELLLGPGGGPDWYESEANLEIFESFLKITDGGAEDLAAAFPDDADDETRVRWLAAVEQKAQNERDHQAQSTSAGTPEFDENYGLYRLYDAENRAYLWSTDAAAPVEEWMSQSAADAYAEQLRPADAGGSQDPKDDGSQWAWDEGWGMFYRVGPSGGYEYSRSLDEARTAPDGVWLTAEQVTAQRRQQAAQDEPQPATEPATADADAPPGGGSVDLETALERLSALGLDAVRDVVNDLEELFAAATELGIGA